MDPAWVGPARVKPWHVAGRAIEEREAESGGEGKDASSSGEWIATACWGLTAVRPLAALGLEVAAAWQLEAVLVAVCCSLAGTREALEGVVALVVALGGDAAFTAGVGLPVVEGAWVTQQAVSSRQ